MTVFILVYYRVAIVLRRPVRAMVIEIIHFNPRGTIYRRVQRIYECVQINLNYLLFANFFLLCNVLAVELHLGLEPRFG